ncbi:hypothetical protein PXD04_04290 [Methanosphaera sp. ISO3-F5]|uniref:hypothetical protein n=1 Tax=Methanosphaera sp. ISO3-F5 TaxID=1452353 RepID=UPI002B25BBE8|nr:hypothetical protein [Methanosphaera sp. ISO3-F5]WQH65008.1 hypothetical protein PXD04_04290 [Methanosphaera sp. ISO3-F5]
MFKKDKKTTNLFDKTINDKKRIQEEILEKELDNLNNVIKSEKYNIDTMISKTKLGTAYHDLINSKDKLSSDYLRKYNQTYHSIDIELRKLNKKLDNETRMINYRYNNKKGKVLSKVLTKIVG